MNASNKKSFMTKKVGRELPFHKWLIFYTSTKFLIVLKFQAIFIATSLFSSDLQAEHHLKELLIMYSDYTIHICVVLSERCCESLKKRTPKNSISSVSIATCLQRDQHKKQLRRILTYKITQHCIKSSKRIVPLPWRSNFRSKTLTKLSDNR